MRRVPQSLVQAELLSALRPAVSFALQEPEQLRVAWPGN